MNELEQRLRDLRGELAWPATPAFEPVLERRRSWAGRRAALALALLLVAVAAGALALSPGARSAFLELFRLKGASVQLVETLPQAETGRPDFGERVAREEAERRVGFSLLDLGEAEPDAVFVRADRMATLVYGPVERPRLVLSQLRGAVWEGFLKKVGAGGTTVEEVRVRGERGLFLSGDEHVVMFVGEDGRVTGEETHLAGTVLLWNRGELLLRLEGELSRAEALELAQMVE